MANFSDGLSGTAGSLLSARTGWAALVAGGGLSDGRLVSTGDGYSLGQGGAVDAMVLSPTTQPAGPDQFAGAVIIASGTSYQVGVRVTLGGAAGFGGYFLRRSNTTSAGMTLARRSTSALSSTAYTTIGTGDGSNVTDPVYLFARGNQIWVEQNGTTIVGPVSDSNFPAGSVGTHPRGPTPASPATAKTIDNWSSGDLTAAAYTITAAPGSFVLTGQTATLRASRKILAAPGAFGLSAAAAAVRPARRLAAASAGFALVGPATSLRADRRFPAQSGPFTADAAGASLRVSRLLSATPGLFALTGNDAQLRVTHTGGPVPADHILVVPTRARVGLVDPNARVAVTTARRRTLST